MPYSDQEGKDYSRMKMKQANPFWIWDIGPGAGTYADLMYPEWSPDLHHWTAVEVWEPYVHRFGLTSKYNRVIVDDVMNVEFDDNTTDGLVILGDVLEHLLEDEARELIVRCKEKFRWMLVSLPIIHAPQGTVFGNPYEAHLKHWTFDEMHAAMGNCEALKGHTLGVYWWDRELNA